MFLKLYVIVVLLLVSGYRLAYADGHWFGQATISFGQSYSTEGGSNPLLSFGGGAEFGYVAPKDSWARLEASAETFFGRVGYRLTSADRTKATMPIGFGLLAKFGYGYSLGHGVLAIVKGGVGPLLARYSATDSFGNYRESTNSLLGLAAQAAFSVVVPLSDLIDINAGIRFTHMQFDLDRVNETNGNTTNQKIEGKSIRLNVPEASLGLRFKF